MVEKIAVVAGGGHVSCFSAGVLGMLDALEEKAKDRFTLVGAKKGLKGLVEGNFEEITRSRLNPHRAGIFFGADRFVAKPEELADAMEKNKVYACIMMGGDNHLGEADRAHDIGVKIVGWPKTMDGDISAGVSLGWDTATNVATRNAILHRASAITNKRIFFQPVFCRDTDFVIAPVALYGGVDFVIPCEQDYTIEYIMEKVKQIHKDHKGGVIPVSEGANIIGLDPPPDKYCSYDPHGLIKLQPEILGIELVMAAKGRGISACMQAHTYDLRDSPPTENDVELAKAAGREDIYMILEGDFGNCAVFRPNEDFFEVSRDSLQHVSQKRKLRNTGYFDYETLQPTGKLLEDYGRLFGKGMARMYQEVHLRDNLSTKPATKEEVTKFYGGDQ